MNTDIFIEYIPNNVNYIADHYQNQKYSHDGEQMTFV